MSRKEEGVLRHFEGWELGAIAVLVALLATLLLAPLRAMPDDVPLPVADLRRITERVRLDRERAAGIAVLLERDQARAMTPSLQGGADHQMLYDLRAFGEAFRAYGRAEASSDMYEVVRMRKKLLDAVNVARVLGEGPLLGIRAYEKQLFLDELAHWEQSRVESEELRGLGGSFVSSAARYGWLAGTTLDMDPRVRGIFFDRRWNDLTGLTEAPFDLSADEHRALYRFLMTHPPVEAALATPEQACLLADEWRLRKLGDIAHIDPAYPAAFARGILLYRVGRYPAAVEALRAHLAGTEGGRYALRARNYLAEATARAAETPINP